MCVTCGCSDDNNNVKITNLEDIHTHILADGTTINHTHSHNSQNNSLSNSSINSLNNNIKTSEIPSQIHSQIHGTTISIEEKILSKNNLLAAHNRGWFAGRNIFALNFMSSPGSGKTTLLTQTINDLKNQLVINVIEGDQETANDAKKIRETGCSVVQINTGTGCHLDAAMVEKGLKQLNPPLDSVVIIENVGNLVCPALFDLGETYKVVILSVTEGDDKPIKYPHIFRNSDVMIITKIDLLPYIHFDLQRCLEYALQVNPQIKIFQVSAVHGNGLDSWYEWLTSNIS
ncbi:MAG: hydrogenase nickel incorporation protein HypB [Cyanobacteria bacterium P01_A01_bin.84]